ncbi:hypothetical protein BST24_03070 [Mycobacteroides franklinii]|nr:hypothetical protein BST24_03070 [Mycobacteroides franklinii]
MGRLAADVRAAVTSGQLVSVFGPKYIKAHAALVDAGMPETASVLSPLILRLVTMADFDAAVRRDGAGDMPIFEAALRRSFTGAVGLPERAC